MMFLFQDGADDRKNMSIMPLMRVVLQCCSRHKTQSVKSQPRWCCPHLKYKNSNTKSFFKTHGDVLAHHQFHIFQSLCHVCMVVDLSHLCYVINGIIESDDVIFAFVSVPELCAVIFLFVDGVDDRKRSDQFSHSFAVYP